MPAAKPIFATLLLLALAPYCAVAFDDYEDAPIRYSTAEPTEVVAKLRKQLEDGTFDFDRSGDQKAFLRSVLKTLKVPEASQVLVGMTAMRGGYRIRCCPPFPASVFR